MSSLLTIANCRALIKTTLSDAELQEVIDRVEFDITAKIGAPQNDQGTVEITEKLHGGGEHLFLRVAITSVTSVTEDSALLDADDYCVWESEGMIERLPEGSHWGDVCSVIYKPADQQQQRIQATIDLVRLVIERTAMASESVGGEYNYTAPDWDASFRRIMKKMCFTEV